MSNGYKKGVYRACLPEELELATEDGWLIIDKIEDQAAICVSKCYVSDPGSSIGPSEHHYTIEEPMKQVRFLIRKDENPVIETMRAEIIALAKSNGTSKERMDELVNDRADLKEELIGMTKAFQSKASNFNSLTERAKKQCDAIQKLERSMGKIQNAIGSLRIEDILGED